MTSSDTRSSTSALWWSSHSTPTQTDARVERQAYNHLKSALQSSLNRDCLSIPGHQKVLLRVSHRQVLSHPAEAENIIYSVSAAEEWGRILALEWPILVYAMMILNESIVHHHLWNQVG